METKQETSTLLEKLDLYSIIRDLLRNAWVIALGAIAVGLIVNMSVRSKIQSTYSTKAMFVVTSRTSGNYAYSNLSAASTMATSYSNILNSNLLKKKVCRDLNVDSFNATMSAKVISDTNLMTLRVTSDTPENTYKIIRSVMKNVADLAGYVSTDMVMEVLQEPTVPTKSDIAVSSRRQTVKAAVIAGLAFAAVFAFLSYRKDTIKSEKDMEEKLDAHTLGMFYYNGSKSLKSLFSRKKKKLLITELDAKFEFVERNKKVAALVAAQAKHRGAKVILVTSVQEHEGKSTVSANLALSLAQQAHSVLLIDGDLRRPTLNSLFLEKGEEENARMPEFLTGGLTLDEAIYFDEKRDIHLLLNDRNYSNSTDIVSSAAMSHLIDEAKSKYEYVIIDSPPMSLMADAEVMADLSDLSILVVKYDTILAPDINDAIDSLRNCSAEFEGCVLNQVRALPGERRTVVGYGGYGRYGHYGNYGRYGRYGKYGKYGNYGHYGNYGYYGHYGEQSKKDSAK
ncbi:MAG: polysaccharide biosynthesis tyrosine autokinase [Clostridia bacterium]|nr:polysaccharide biosynthesis tyrosine autokinase [Clostridia bacterium]